jgi:hypothetical protein
MDFESIAARLAEDRAAQFQLNAKFSSPVTLQPREACVAFNGGSYLAREISSEPVPVAVVEGRWKSCSRRSSVRKAPAFVMEPLALKPESGMGYIRSIVISLGLYAVAFIALRFGGVAAAHAAFDWILLVAAASLAVYLSSPVSVPQAAAIFTATGTSAFVLALLISYVVLGDSF